MWRVRRALTAALILVASTSALADSAPQETLDFSDLMTPTCELAGLVASPPQGWFNVPFQDAPDGHRGCQMMRTGADDELLGILRVRSVTAAAAEFGPRALPEGGGAFEEYAALLANEHQAVSAMGYRLAEEPLRMRDEVPVAGEGFRDGRAVVMEASVAGSDVSQEVHFLVFRGPDAKYLFSVLTPDRSAYPDVYQADLDGFGRVLATLQPSES